VKERIFSAEEVRDMCTKPLDVGAYAHNRVRALNHAARSALMVRQVIIDTWGKGKSFRPHGTTGEADLRFGLQMEAGIETTVASLETDLGINDDFFDDNDQIGNK